MSGLRDNSPFKRPNRRRGFAGILAILLLLLVGMTLTTVATAFSADARRTRVRAADAQLRQILTAGAIAAAKQFEGSELPAGEKPLALPADLASAGATATIAYARDGENAVVVRVHASIPPRRMSQTLRFAQSGGKWSMRSAELE